MHLWRIPLSTWDGLIARAAPGTHEGILELLQKNKVPTQGKQVDLACGTGALIARLRSHGYQSFEGVDLNPDQCGLKEFSPKVFSLDKPFAEKFEGKFNLVTASEIIEHLENPWQFLREIKSLLAPGAYAIISTPNVAHWLGRVQFAVKGVPKYFSEADFHEQRHITPIHDHHMRLMLKEIGFKLVDFKCTATSWGPLLRLLTAPLAFPFWLMDPQRSQGNINIYLISA